MRNIKSFQEYNDQLNEGFLSKSLIAGLLMSIGSLSAPGKTEEDYWKEQERLAKQDDIPLDGLQDPSFKSTKCGISKAGAKDAKKRMV